MFAFSIMKPPFSFTDIKTITIFVDFLRIFEEFPKLFRKLDERPRTFSENFRGFPKIANDFRGRPEDLLDHLAMETAQYKFVICNL